ncbi:hypothetical protein EV363DRAFT_1354325 [Boletus edulis]|uniref:Lupus La protein n=1 Tax=Boletus edulis BED1 TaxID=1328754 RepID=A0AAD4BG98_BOLED|nr:hypothetical protein EV363DRAFT_1354325 [Boletus edulis]KAF8428040.1 hypothetical protein L210DRAFT_3564431 [Boletus edulis BED1]
MSVSEPPPADKVPVSSTVAEPASTTAAAYDDESLAAACKQVEFYFADCNLPFDKFMWTLHTANADHWVPIKTISSFKRMRDHSAKGHEFILRALKTSTQLEVDEKGDNVRRTAELQKPKDQFGRSVYAKGFGKEEPGLQQELEAFFEQYGGVNAVRMRRVDGKKEFKGSVFVEFADMTGVEAFLSVEPKPSWKGEELLIMSKGAYCDMKIKEKGLTGKIAELRKDSISSRKGFNAFREMESDSKSKSSGKSREKPEVFLEFMGEKIRVYDDNEEGVGYVKTEDVPFVRGATLKFTGCGGDANFTEMKAPLRERFARVPYIQFSKGDDFGLVGFEKALKEDEIEYVKENLKTVNSKEVVWTIPDEEEEKQFQIDRANFAAKSALSRTQMRKGSSGRGGRGGRGSRGGGRQGGGDRKKTKEKIKDAPQSIATSESQTGEKRKRDIEPDGGPDVGVRGTGVPTIAAAKKVRADDP